MPAAARGKPAGTALLVGHSAGVQIGYHASHEQFAPEDLLALVQSAEAAGFTSIMSSDHFHPWSPDQGHSGFAWSWLGAALQATSLSFGSIAVPGGWRYHPAIVAQAAATIARMFPGRFAWIGLGSGQALNEHITGERWPPKHERNARLKEAQSIIRRLWAGETVTEDGLIRIEEAKLYSRADDPPLLFGAALTPATAEWVGGWADGLVTVNKPDEELSEMVDAFDRGGGEGKPKALQVHLSYAEDDATARRLAYEAWRSNIAPPSVAELLKTPEQFDAATAALRPEDMEGHVVMSCEPERFVERIRSWSEMGFGRIYLHNVGPNQREFIEVFGEHVLPALAR